MSYGVLYTCTHKADTNGTETTYTIEILKKSYPGFAQEVIGWGETFSLEYDRVNVREPFRTPINEARMEFYATIRSSDELDLLNEIFSGDEDTHQLRLKQNGSVVWTGFILKDLMQYSNGDYPYKATIVAKDLTRLSQFTFPLQDIRQKLIVTIADLLDDLGLGLDIYTYTNWTNDSFTGSDDFLNLTYHETHAMRDYKESGYEDDVPQTNEFWLESILRNFGLILRQTGGVWRIYQLSGLTDSEAVKEYKYNSSGVQQSSSTTDISTVVDESTVFLSPSSINFFHPAIKQATVVWDHRSPLSGIQIPDQFTFDGAGSETYTQFFLSDGTQSISLQLSVQATYTSQPATEDLYANFQVYVETTGSDYYLKEDGSWTTTATDITVNLRDNGGRTNDGEPTSYTASGSIGLGSGQDNTNFIPTGADGQLTVKFFSAPGASYTIYRIGNFNVIGSTDETNSDALAYSLTQTGNYSYIYDHGTVYFGDGPVKYADSALRFSSDNDDVTADGWKRVGEVSSDNFFKLLLREFVELQANGLRMIEAEMYGSVSASQMLLYESTHFFMLGGSFNGYNIRRIDYLAISYSSPTTTFSELIKKQSAQGLPSGGGGFDTQTSTGEYLQVANNLSDVESAITSRQNLGVEIGVDVQGFDQNLEDISGLAVTDGNIIVGDGANFVAESGNTARTSLGLGESDTPKFANLQLSSTNPVIYFNGTADGGDGASSDMAIKATPEGLDFYEPEDADKIHFQIYDDTGVNARYGYFSNGTRFIDDSLNLVNIGTIDTGQGATEVYLMNQNVRTTDSPSFYGLTIGQGTVGSQSSQINLKTYDTVDAITVNFILKSPSGAETLGTDRTLTLPDATGILAYWASGNTNNRVLTSDGASGLVGEANLTFDGTTLSSTRLTLTQTTGTAPMTVSSTTVVTNLNADLLDGQHKSYYLDYANFTGTPPVAGAAGSDGQVQYNNGGSLGGASALYYDDVNDRVGIGTASPQTGLDINGNIRITGRSATPTSGAGMELFYYSANDSFYIEGYNYSTSAYKPIRFGASNFIFNQGNVGIGATPSASYKLDVNGSQIIRGDLTINKGSAGSPQYIYNENGGSDLIIYTNSGRVQVDDDFTVTQGAVFNEDGGNYDFRVEGDTDQNLLFVDASADAVGIGVSPVYKLDVVQDANSLTALRVRNNDSGASAYAGLIINPYGNSWLLRSGSTTANSNSLEIALDATSPSVKAIINSSGNVGIGTTSPNKTLEVNGTGAFGTSIYRTFVYGDGAGSYIDFGTIASNASLGKLGHYSSEFRFQSYNRAFNFLQNSSSHLYISTGGNVGIGTGASASYKLDVNGVVNANGVLIGTNGDSINRAGDLYIQTTTASSLILRTNSSPRMTITSGGFVGIGTTSPSALLNVGATGTLHYTETGIGSMLLKGISGTARAMFELHSADSNVKTVVQSVSGYGFNIGTLTSSDIILGTSGQERMRIDSSGNVGIGVSPINNFDVFENSKFSVNVEDATYTRFGNLYSSDGIAVLEGLGDVIVAIDSNNNRTGKKFAVRNDGITGTELFTVSDNGYVGIGTASPSEKLEVNGIIRILPSSGSPELRFTDNGVANRAIRMIDGANRLSIIADNLVTEQVCITSTGNVGIGTTTTTEKMDVNGNIKVFPTSGAWAEGLSFSMSTTSTWGGLRWRRERANYDGNWYVGYTALDSTDDLVFGANNGGTQVNNIIRITKAGTVAIDTASPNASYKFHLGSGNGLVENNFDVVGTLSKGGGSFRIPHPDPAKPTMELWHSFTESPTAGENLYRWQVEVKGGIGTILLPDYYKHLNENDQVWVSPFKHFGQAWGEVTDDQEYLIIHANEDGLYNVLLIGTRKDSIAKKAWKGAEREGDLDYIRAAKNYNLKQQ